MIKSMTAYARTEKQMADYTFRVEVHAYNSRHLDVAVKLSHGFESLAERIKAVVAETVARGRVDIRIQIHGESEAGIAFEVNLPRAKAYYQALVQLNQSLGLTEPIPVDSVLAAGSMVQALEMEKDLDSVWSQLEPCLRQAMTQLDAMRQVEGRNLARDFRERLDAIEAMLAQIGTQAEQLPEMYHLRLMARIDVLTRGVVEIDQTRIAQEAALLADRSDISEEIVRAQSHIQQFRTLMDDNRPAGRPLNFLLQEFNREFNTMGSKSGQAPISHAIVAVKSELEKLREQVQNVE
jgi:uncharacterized protein (TIGR00255 family)